MIDFITLTDAMVDKLRKIPPLVAELNNKPEAIVGYIDIHPTRNSVRNASYEMPAASLLVAWKETVLSRAAEEMYAWVHHIEIYARGRLGASAMTVIHKIVNGVPTPGDGQPWRYCPIMDGVLPTSVTEIARSTDDEGIDLFVMLTETQETGDTF
jgi:hypothetical protein